MSVNAIEEPPHPRTSTPMVTKFFLTQEVGKNRGISSVRTKQDYLYEIPFEYLLGFIGLTALLRNYNYFTKKDFVQALLRNIAYDDCELLYNFYKKGSPFEEASTFYLNKNPTAEYIKIKFEEHLHLNEKDVGSLRYEFPIPNSRVDILRINNNSYAYEIKSIRDSIKRLDGQLNALYGIFENIYLIIPEYLRENLDEKNDSYGIIYFNECDNKIKFITDRYSNCDELLNPKKQLDILTYTELNNLFYEVLKNTNIKNREDLEKEIMDNNSKKEINQYFKKYIQNKINKNSETLVEPIICS